MVFIPAPNVAQVEMLYSNAGNVMENVYHVLGSAPWTNAQLDALAHSFIGWESTTGKTKRSHDTQLDLVRARDMSTQAGPVAEVNDTLPIVGVVAGNSYPGNVTLAISWRTGLGGRSYRGRTYHIGLWEDVVTNNMVDNGTTANLVAMYAALLTAINSGGNALVVLSKYHNKAPRTTAVATPIVNCKVDGKVDSQRRRLLGR